MLKLALALWCPHQRALNKMFLIKKIMKYKTIHSNSGLYFVSSVIAKHKSIFWTDPIALIPLKSLNWFCEQDLLRLFAFCPMPNHLHVIIKLSGKAPIEKILASLHKFSGREIVKYFEIINDIELLNFFKIATKGRKDRNHLI
jgi:REP element-mobilizing transposase RayT